MGAELPRARVSGYGATSHQMPDNGDDHGPGSDVQQQAAPVFQDPQGKVYPAVPVTVEDSGTFSGLVKLGDGTTLQIRVIVTAVAKAVGLTDSFGRPVYHVETATLVSVKPS